MPTTNIITYEEPWLISADTNYQGYRVNLETGECIPTGKRVLRKWEALKDIFPGLVAGKSFMDIGCAQGFFGSSVVHFLALSVIRSIKFSSSFFE